MNDSPSFPIRPMARTSLHEEVAAHLRGLILEAKLRPGVRIAEADLCRQLGVSRTPLREALKVLAAERLVDLLPNRGAVVAQVTIEETEQLFELLETLEGMIGALAPVRAPDAEIARLAELHGEMAAHHAAGRRAEYFAVNQRIHQGLVEAARNAPLAATHLSCSRRVSRARYAANFSQMRWDESLREHAAALAALQARDPSALSEILRRHLRRTADHVLAGLRASGLPARSSGPAPA